MKRLVANSRNSWWGQVSTPAVSFRSFTTKRSLIWLCTQNQSCRVIKAIERYKISWIRQKLKVLNRFATTKLNKVEMIWWNSPRNDITIDQLSSRHLRWQNAQVPLAIGWTCWPTQSRPFICTARGKRIFLPNDRSMDALFPSIKCLTIGCDYNHSR